MSSERPLLALPLAVLVALAAATGDGPAAASAQSTPPVLVIGDSLEVGSGPYVRRDLGGIAVTVDARNGRSSAEGLRILEERLRPEHGVVVFDLGTNDDPSRPEAFAGILDGVRSLVGDRCLVVATLNRPPVNGVAFDAMNEALSRFAASAGARVVDWRAAALRDPGLLGGDGVHAGPRGYAVRGGLVARAVRACVTGGGGDEDGLPDPRPGGASPPARGPAAPPPGRPPSTGEPLLSLSLLDAGRPLLGYAEGAIRAFVKAGSRVRLAVGPLPPEPVLGARE